MGRAGRRSPFADLYTFKADEHAFTRQAEIRQAARSAISTTVTSILASPTLFDVKREHVPYMTNGSADDFDDNAFCAEGDLVFADASEDLNDVGKSIEIVALNGEPVLSGTHTILATRRLRAQHAFGRSHSHVADRSVGDERDDA